MYSIIMTTVLHPVGCVKSATEVLGNKWTPQLLRFLANNPAVRFCQLQDMVGGINPRTLSSRLVELESRGIIKKSSYDSSSRSTYRLTAKGKDLIPILNDMYLWGEKYEENCL